MAIAPKVPGRVTGLPVSDNQPVREGDILLVIDDADYRAAHDQAAAALAAARAAADVAEAEATLASAQAERTRATADLTRYKTLSASHFASQQKVQTTQANATKARAAVERAAAALATEKSRLDLLAAERRQADVLVEKMQAELAAARIRLEDTVLRAPVNGIVGNKGVQLGLYVQTGQQTMSVVPINGVYVIANFKETQLARMHQGQPVEITVDDLPRPRLPWPSG